MGLIISQSDFKGKYAISQNNYSLLPEYIDKYEESYLIHLLGFELFELFKADLDNGVPQDDRFVKIFEPLYTRIAGKLIHSEGMNEMLRGFIYFEFVRDDKFKNTISGANVNQGEVSREAGFTEFNLYDRYNLAIGTYHSIRTYCLENKEIYPEFDGIEKQLAYWV